MRKSLLVLPLVCFFVNTASAAKTAEVQPTESDIKQFLNNDEIKRARSLAKFGTGYYFGLGSTYDGSDLLINEPSLHKDLGLLQQNNFMDAHVGTVGDNGARVQFSGNVNAAASYHFSPQPAAEKSAIDAAIELDVSAEVNDYLTGYLKFAGSTDTEEVVLDQAFVVVGDLDKTPWYGSVGKIFVPTGDYSTYMIAAPLTRGLGRNKANAATVGYYEPDFSGEAFVWQGFTQRTTRREIDQWGANADFHPVSCPGSDFSYQFGASYMNHMGDSDNIVSVLGEGTILDHYVDAVNVHAKTALGAVAMRAEYITALRSFDAADLPGATDDREPKAMNVEAAYSIPGMSKQTRLIAGYGQTWESEELSLAEHQYGVAGTMTVLKNTIVALEVLRKEPYTGRTDYVATVQVDLYF
jgi:hypothetical protein